MLTMLYLVVDSYGVIESFNPTLNHKISWFVLLLLCTHSKKHIFKPKKPLVPHRYFEAATDLKNKTKWAYVCRHEPSGRASKAMGQS